MKKGKPICLGLLVISPIEIKAIFKTKAIMRTIDALMLLELKGKKITKINMSQNVYTYFRENYYNAFLTFIMKYDDVLKVSFKSKNKVIVKFKDEVSYIKKD